MQSFSRARSPGGSSRVIKKAHEDALVLSADSSLIGRQLPPMDRNARSKTGGPNGRAKPSNKPPLEER
jgi:hypothetical protein